MTKDELFDAVTKIIASPVRGTGFIYHMFLPSQTNWKENEDLD
jgi:uncharacterized membrane protein